MTEKSGLTCKTMDRGSVTKAKKREFNGHLCLVE